MKSEIRNPKHETNSEFKNLNSLNSCLFRASSLGFRVFAKRRGFTIIETLVAITILMIAIAGPLTVATQAINAAYDARNQMIATNLAQETLEVVKNLKDNYVLQSSSTYWPSIVSGYTETNKWGMQVIDSGGYVPVDCHNDSCRMYTDTTTGMYAYNYSDTSGDTLLPTPFTRYFYITPVSGDPDEYMLTVVVSWATGSVSNQVQIQELLVNASR